MSEIRDMLTDTARRVLAAAEPVARSNAVARGEFPAAQWQEIEEAGLSQMSVVDGELDLGDVTSVIREAGYWAAPLPLADTLLGQWMLAEAGLPAAPGPVAVGPVLESDRLVVEIDGGRELLRGTLRAVPFGRACRTLVALAESGGETVLIRLALDGVARREGRDLAQQPCDTLLLDGLELSHGSVHRCPKGLDREALLRRGALFRCAAMAGAIARVLDLSVRYVKERHQFGQPLAKFQAVQQMMAQLAGASAAATAAATAATAGVERGNGAFEVAAAKARIGDAATLASRIGHQVHGAMGFTREHELHLSTRLLWVWREEYGSEAHWHRLLGRTALQAGGDALWRLIVEPGMTRLAWKH